VPSPTAPHRRAPLAAVLAITFLGSVSGGAFWAGIFFVTADRYHFSPSQNLILGAVMGAVYALAARRAGPLLRALETGDRGISARAALGAILGTWGLAALAPLCAPNSQTVLWVVAVVGSATSALTWPIVESYLSAGRRGADLRRAIGWFNITWTPATATPLLLMPLLARYDVLWTLAVAAIVNSVAIVVLLLALPARPGAHETAPAESAIGVEYPWLMQASSWLLPLSYVMSSTLSPILPHRLAAVGVGAAPESVIAAIWMIARFATLLAMWRIGFWHGRWGTLALAGAALTAGMSTVLLATTLPVVIVGLVVFGAGMGITYYATLYYSLAVGHGAVDAGGSFESLIGVGYSIGPLLGLIGHATGGPGRAGPVTVALTCVVAGAAAAAAWRPYREARRRRSS
jgi:hypothetical protein